MNHDKDDPENIKHDRERLLHGFLDDFFFFRKNFCMQEFPVHTSDIQNGNTFGAFGFTGIGVAATAEPELIHAGNHALNPFCRFDPSLRKQGEMRNLRTDEKHGRSIGTGCNAGAATDTGGGIER